MPSNDKIRALVTSVDRFTVYNPKPITKKFQEDKAFYVLGERIEIKHVHGSKIEAPDVDIMQRSVQVYAVKDSSEQRRMRRRADSDPEALSSPRLTKKPIRKREFKIARSQDTELSSSESGTKGSSSDESSDSAYFKKQFAHANWNIFQRRVFFNHLLKNLMIFLFLCQNTLLLKKCKNILLSLIKKMTQSR